MLTALRTNVSSPIFYIPIAMIIVVFIFTFGSWGGGDVSGTMPTAAIVNGRVIPQAQFDVAYSNRFINQQRSRPGYNVDAAKTEKDADGKPVGLKSIVVDQLIDMELLAQAAEDRGLVVTDEQLREFITGTLFRNEEFDAETYERYVSNQHQTTMPRFEDQMRREILAQRMLGSVSEGLKVSQSEVKEIFENRSNRANLNLVRVDPLFFKNAGALEGEALTKWTTDNDAKIKEYYNEFINRYRTEATVDAAQILIKLSPNATDAQVKAAKDKAIAAKARLAKEDFALVAKSVSEDASAKVGGSLGTVTKGQMLPAFDKAAFALNVGDVSEPVQSKIGFHIIKVTAKTPAKVKELNEVKETIAAKLSKDDAQKVKAKAMAEDILAKLKAGTAITELKVPGLLTEADLLKEETPDPYAPRVESTGFFAKSARYIPRVGTSPEIAKKAFELTKEAPVAGEVFEVNRRFYVLSLKERETADMSKFDEEKGAIEKGIRGFRQQELLRSFSKTLRESATITRNPKVLGYGS